MGPVAELLRTAQRLQLDEEVDAHHHAAELLDERDGGRGGAAGGEQVVDDEHALAYVLQTGFVPVRKQGKLPRQTLSVSYALEYGEGVLEIHADAIAPGQRVLVVDDLLATGGTAAATVSLVEQLGGEVAGIAFLVELEALGGAKQLGDRPHVSLIRF